MQAGICNLEKLDSDRVRSHPLAPSGSQFRNIFQEPCAQAWMKPLREQRRTSGDIMRPSLVPLAVIGLWIGCYDPNYQPGIMCGKGVCPSGLICDIDGICRRDPLDGGSGSLADSAEEDRPDARPSVDACVSASETCNGVDDDCDELIDEGFPGTGTPCDGPDADDCIEGTIVCDPEGASVTCSDDSDDEIELCNDIDDDCDGETNEGYAGLGQSCDSGDADLCTDDVRRCSANGREVVCDDSGLALVERCNGIDDDCDGTRDEGFDVGQTCDGPDGDSCPDGVRQCRDDQTGTLCSDPGPAIAERCNGADDDCDGSIDEDYPSLGQACDRDGDADACALGVVVCNSDGTGTACAETEERPEICDGSDNDCDGGTDEGMPCPLGLTCCGVRCCGFNETCCRSQSGIFSCRTSSCI